MTQPLPLIEPYNQYQTSSPVVGFFHAYRRYLNDYYYKGLAPNLNEGEPLGIKFYENIEIVNASPDWVKTLGMLKYGIGRFPIKSNPTLWDSSAYDSGYIWDYQGGRIELTPDIYRACALWIIRQDEERWTTMTMYRFLWHFCGYIEDAPNGGYKVESSERGFVLSAVEGSIPDWLAYLVQYQHDFLGLPYGVDISIIR